VTGRIGPISSARVRSTLAPEAASAMRSTRGYPGIEMWDSIRVPSACDDIRIASFDAWEQHEPPAYIRAKSGLLMFTVQIGSRWLANYPQTDVRAQQMMDVVRGIQNRMRPQIFDWKRTNWFTRVTPVLAKSMLENAGRIAKPTNDTAWALNWNHAGPALKKPRHITGINSMPPELFEQLLEQQTDAAAAESLSWLYSVQPGWGGILPKQGILWFSIEVLKDPRLRLGAGSPPDEMPTIPPGTTGPDLLTASSMPFDTDFLVQWATRLASQELRDHRLGTLAVAIPSWIPGVSIDGMTKRGYEQPTSHHAGDWREDTTRNLWAEWENRRLNMAGYYGAPRSEVIAEKKTRATRRLSSAAVPFTWPAGTPRGNVGDVAMVGHQAVVNIGSPDQAVVVDYMRGLPIERVSPDEINRLYDIASVVASGWVDILVPFFSQILMGPSTDRRLREEWNRWQSWSNLWQYVVMLVTQRRQRIEAALAFGEQARSVMVEQPQLAMSIVNQAIDAVEKVIAKLGQAAQSYDPSMTNQSIASVTDGTAASAVRQIRTGLNVAIDKLRRRLGPASTESQGVHATCLLYKKANYESRQWPAKWRAILPALQLTRGAMEDVAPRIPQAIADYQAALERLLFIKSQIPMPWWQRRFGPLPVWTWGLIGTGAFLGSAYGVRRRIKRKRPKKNRRRTSRRAR
jgi:hypothetical protein